MKFHKFASVFDYEAAELALLSSFNFDTDYFERRLLRSKALAKARRIAVFVDYGEWLRLLKQDAPARWINQRYLVVPVRRPSGVFHPKLQLLISEKGCRISCGSGNLTRSGCTHNLELLNCLTFDSADEAQHQYLPQLARSALRMFIAASRESQGDAGGIAAEWLADIQNCFGWLVKKDKAANGLGSTLSIVHTYDGNLWSRLETELADTPPEHLTVISPFFDRDATLLRRIHEKWPHCKVEIIAQQGTSNLPVGAMQKATWKPPIYDIHNTSRRLHAKLVAWKRDGQVGCLVGSANFTTAAFDGRNIEACLYVPNVEGAVDALFDNTLARREVSLSDFEPGQTDEPEPSPEDLAVLLDSAVLEDDCRLRLRFRLAKTVTPTSFSVNLQCRGEANARASLPVKECSTGTIEATVPENALSGLSGSLMATFVVRTEDGPVSSRPMWVIFRDRLTHEAGSGGGGGTVSTIKESGDGLPEYLEELGERGGVSAVVEYLSHLNIRFSDGGGGSARAKKFRLRRSDPFHPDVSPEWWEKGVSQADDLEQAIYEFAERHEKSRLRKHAERGNINGMENFLDIFRAIIRLMYVYYRRKRNPIERNSGGDPTGVTAKNPEQGVVKRLRVIGQLCRLVQVATSGFELGKESSEGYLNNLAWNLRGAPELLHEVCEEHNLSGNIRAALLIAQMLRFDPDEKPLYGPPPKRPSDCLNDRSKGIYESFDYAELEHPSKERVMGALEEYHMFTEEDLKLYASELEK